MALVLWPQRYMVPILWPHLLKSLSSHVPQLLWSLLLWYFPA